MYSLFSVVSMDAEVLYGTVIWTAKQVMKDNYQHKVKKKKASLQGLSYRAPSPTIT